MLPWFTAGFEVPALDDLMRYMCSPVDAYDEEQLEEEWRALEAKAAEIMENNWVAPHSRLWALCSWAVENLPVSDSPLHTCARSDLDFRRIPC